MKLKSTKKLLTLKSKTEEKCQPFLGRERNTGSPVPQARLESFYSLTFGKVSCSFEMPTGTCAKLGEVKGVSIGGCI